MLMRPHVRRIHRQQLLEVLGHPGIEPEHPRDLGQHRIVGAVQGPSMMPLPHRLPRSEIGWHVPPWATRAEPPRDAFQYQTMVTESVAPLTLIRWHHRFDSRPELTPIRVTGQSSLVNTFPFGRHALVGVDRFESAGVGRHGPWR